MQKYIDIYKKYYYWAISDWEREVSQGFPFLTSLGEIAAQNVIDTLQQTELPSFFRAMVKRVTSSQILSELGETVTDEDKEYHQKYLEQWRLVGLTNPMYQKIERANRDKINLSDFKKKIVASLSPILKTDHKDIAGWQLWEYHTVLKDWIIQTRVEIGDENYQLAYSHSVLYKEDMIFDHYSILRWLGISAGTEWHGIINSDVPELIDKLCRLVYHFIKNLSELLLIEGYEIQSDKQLFDK